MFSKLFKKKDVNDPGTDEKYLEFRNIILELDPKKFESGEQIPDTWGVMIDMGIPQLRFTIATAYYEVLRTSHTVWMSGWEVR